MNKTTTLLTLTLLLLSNFIFAQHVHSEKCGHTIMMKSMEEKYPGFNEAVNKTFQNAKAKGAELRQNSRAEVHAIPIVFHVVWHEGSPEQNLADSIIQDQMRVLNEDYRMLNSDAANIRTEFEDIVGDTEIEFVLQEIKRESTTELFEPSLTDLSDVDQVKSSANGGSDAVDPSSTLNIWICKIQPLTFLGFPAGDILGFAYPPAGLSHWPAGANAPTPDKDGVVLDFRTIGSNNPNDVYFENLGFDIIGRTAVHEVGHYLGLRHVWGDAIELLGEDGCAVDDGVDDTPNAATNHQADGCVDTHNTCGAGTTGDLPDMWENYMDYSQETCQVAFTQGQIDLMRGVLAGPRSGLIGGVTCTAPVTGTISGNNDVDISTTHTYSAPSTSNAFTWTITGGAIISGTGTNTIQVQWNATAGPGQVCLKESDGICTGNEECFAVTKNETCVTPTTGSISGASTTLVSTSENYTVSNSGNSYVWTVTGGSISSGQGTNSLTVDWSTGVNGSVCLTESDGACEGNEECMNVTLSTPTGIAEVSYQKGLSIYPNPATSFINVKSNETPTRIELIDVLGKTIAQYNNLTNNNSIAINNLPTSIIFVKVFFENEFALERIVVQ